MKPQYVQAIAIAVAKDALDALVDAGYLVSVGTLAIIGIPFLLVMDVFVALILWFLLGRSWLVFPVAILEAIPGIQVFPTWTAFTLLAIGRGGKL